jgi:P-type Ca2+ transporter type 2C
MKVSAVSDSMPPFSAGIETLTPPLVYEALGTRPGGLSTVEAAARLQQYGRNILPTVKRRPLLARFLANFAHLMALLLWVGGAIGFLAQQPQLGVAIWTVNLINGIFSFWQEYKAEQATEALRKLLPTHVRIRREGKEERILAEELVPGDIMLLAEGDHISADGRLLEETELRVDQSTLTGESHAVRKTAEATLRNNVTRPELPNLVFTGSSVASGLGVAVAFATGLHSEFGKIARLTQEVEETLSPLQQEMTYATKIVTIIDVGIGVLFFFLAVTMAGITLAESFIFAMGMIVAFVPEGMLPTVTLALAMGTQRMARRHALIKRLSAVETLGCTTVICTDKTGTLTQNEMTVRELWFAARQLTTTGVGYAPEGQLLEHGQIVHLPKEPDLRQLILAASLCNDARLLPPNSESTQWRILGDPTEAALLVLAAKSGLDLEAEAQSAPRVREFPFDSRRKRMSTLHQLSPTSTNVDQHSTPSSIINKERRTIFVKGAPKEILALCSRIQRQERELVLDDDWRARIATANDEYARTGLRVLAIAQRVVSPPMTVQTAEQTECDLTFLGLVAMMDPPRPEVAEAVSKCHRAGIRIVMMTGDYGLTAESIARRIGIISGEQPRILAGAELDSIENTALREALAGEVIFARVTPEHKLRVVTVLQEMGHIVAVTGDGVNDAPALKKADIGVAMGLSGTDVAKEAADMILTDDNFASIVNAVEEGRAVYANIKKFLTYIFTSNTPEATPFILFAFSGGRIPLALNVMQILSIDLGTDIVPALALGAEPPEPGIMDHPPRDLREHVITRALLLRSYLWLGLIQSAVAMAAFYFPYWNNGYWGQWLDLPANGPLYRSAMAMTLASVVVTQIGNLFAQRTERLSVFRINWFSNRLVWIGIATELALVVAIVYIPMLQEIFGVAAFPLANWLFLLAWTPALLLADEVRKALVRKKLARREHATVTQASAHFPAGR